MTYTKRIGVVSSHSAIVCLHGGCQQKSGSSTEVFLFLCMLQLATAQRGDYSDLRGPYCERRPGGCCPGRKDECSFPILGTLCYCDDFCNRTRSEDCCPDFWSFCHNLEPPTPPPVTRRCYHGGRYYDYGKEIKINCNKCKCDSVTQTGLEFLCEQKVCLVEPDVISSINSNRQLGWTATNYSTFWGNSLEDGITLRTGTLQPHKTVKRMKPVNKIGGHLPRSFDARTKWPGWVSGPFDQGWCGASWAISTVSVASDRFAIMSQGLEKVHLSPQHLLSCNNRGQRGCQGGHLSRAWMFVRKFGLVDESCYPWTGTATKCKLPKRSNLLTARCPPLPNQRSARIDTFKVGPAYKLKNEEDIMNDILVSGPVQATMKVYQDFFSYKSGVYTKSNFDKSPSHGYHSVKVIGWGEESDVYGQPIKYWLAVNSWGPFWGENGLFKIRRGTNECEIEDFVLAVWAETDETLQKQFMENRSNYGDDYVNNTISADRWSFFG